MPAAHRSPSEKRWLWSAMPMTTTDETDRFWLKCCWHWSLQATAQMLGPGFVWAVGLEALGYPPTWVDMQEEAVIVKAACMERIRKKLELKNKGQ